MIVEEIVENIKTEIKKIVIDLGYATDDFEVVLDIPKDKSHGDFATNTAMRLASKAKKSPQIIAKEIIDEFDAEKCSVKDISVAGPGFINITIKKASFFELINQIVDMGSDYGKSSSGNHEKILLEYVSANPTGYLHIGHARGGAYGDSLSRIMKKAGYDVTREFYVNDAGNQINNLALSIQARYEECLGVAGAKIPENGYHGPEIIEIAKKIVAEKQDKLLTNGFEYFKQYGLDFLMNGLKKHLHDYRVDFDNWYSEKSLYANNQVQAVYQELIDKGYTYEKDGAVFCKTSEFGDEKDRVLYTSDGRFTYLVPDIAYHKTKFDRGYTKLIDVLGSDHHGYLDRLRATLKMIGYDSSKLNFEILQMVKVYQNGKEVKMSKRSGKAIGLEDLILEVGVDPIRYFFAARSLSSPMDLDLDLALRSTNENPVYYAQYAHARICSVLEKAKEQNINYLSTNNYSHLNEKAADLLAILASYTKTVSLAAARRMPHIICNYIQNLASEFHSYYNSDKILTDNEEETKEKLKLIYAVKIVLKDALGLIAVKAPEKM